MVNLYSEITIGKYRFASVNEVRVSRSLHSYVDTAIIKIPSLGSVRQNGKIISGRIANINLFNAGDPVTIKLGYHKPLRTEFQGFLKAPGLNTPLELQCEGYCRRLRLNNSINGYYAHTTVSELLTLATKDTGINIEVQNDIPLNDIKLINASGEDICDYIKKATEGVIAIYFKEPTLLWAGLLYTPYAGGTDPLKIGRVQFRLGYNVLQDNSLKRRSVEDNPVQVIFGNKLPTGEKIFTSSQLKSAAAKLKRLLVHVPSAIWLERLANEKQYRGNYAGYEGKITAFLEPFALPGYTALIKDKKYPALDGVYLIESTEVIFNASGARRYCEIGPKLSFNV